MTPNPSPPPPEHPLDPILAFHRRIERRLADLAALPSRLEMCGMDAEAMGAAASILRAFGASAAFHHAVEEREILPAIRRRIVDPASVASFRALRTHLEGDHREIERAWRELRRPLEALAEGAFRPLSAEGIGYFRALWTAHICMEESSLHLAALGRDAWSASSRHATATALTRR